MKILKFIFLALIFPYLIIINIWMIFVSIKNFKPDNVMPGLSKEDMEHNSKLANKDLLEFHEKLPYILKLVPTVIILYFYFR